VAASANASAAENAAAGAAAARPLMRATSPRMLDVEVVVVFMVLWWFVV
jgi:hypothetical protein